MTNSEAERLQGIAEFHLACDHQPKHAIHRMMHSRPENEGEIKSPEKRPRVIFGALEERDSSSTTPNGATVITDERMGGSTGVGASKLQSLQDGYYQHDPSQPPEARMTTYHPLGVALEQNPEQGPPSILVQRSQRENYFAESPYGFGNGSPRRLGVGANHHQLSPQQELLLLHGQQRASSMAQRNNLPSTGAMGDGTNQLTPQEELQLLKEQRVSAMAHGHRPPSSGVIIGESGFLPSPQPVYPGVAPFQGSVPMQVLSSGAPNSSLLYDQYQIADQVPYGGLPYEVGGGGGDMPIHQLTQHRSPYGQRISPMMSLSDVPSSAMGMSDIAMMSSPPGVYYGDSVLQGQVGIHPGNNYAGPEPHLRDSLRSDSLTSQRFPHVAASTGMGRSHVDLALERAQIRREVMLDQGQQLMEKGRQLLYQSRQIPIRVPDTNALTLYVRSDEEALSQYQCVVRKQIELFAAEQIDVETNAQGRNKPIVLHQVGIRCLHCAAIHPKHRARGGTYYPSKLSGFYQAAQNMASSHLCQHCTHVPRPLRRQLLLLRERKSSAGGGKEYWADAVKALGVIEDTENGILRFKKEEEKSNEPEIAGTAPTETAPAET